MKYGITYVILLIGGLIGFSLIVSGLLAMLIPHVGQDIPWDINQAIVGGIICSGAIGQFIFFISKENTHGL
jgi:hypothetical protein